MNRFFTDWRTRSNTQTATGAIQGARLHIGTHVINMDVKNSRDLAKQLTREACERGIVHLEIGRRRVFFYPAYPVILETY